MAVTWQRGGRTHNVWGGSGGDVATLMAIGCGNMMVVGLSLVAMAADGPVEIVEEVMVMAVVVVSNARKRRLVVKKK